MAGLKKNRTGAWRWAGAVVTGLCLFASFPPIGSMELAWVALVPLLVAVRGDRWGCAFRRGWVAGLVFWVPGIVWLHYVTVFGWLLLCMYCALYLAVFAAGIALLWEKLGGTSWYRNVVFMMAAAASWVSLEWIRSWLFTGFGWNTLAVSQYTITAICQMAAWGGVYLLSAVIVFFNAGIATTVVRYAENRGRPGRTAHPELGLSFLVLALGFALGMRTMRHDALVATPAHIGLVQTNIPQMDKWDDETIPEIYRRLLEWTEVLHEDPSIDLVLWPETALPDDVRFSEPSFQLVQYLARRGKPLLVGSMDVRPDPDDQSPLYFNSSFLFETDGSISYAYDKQHLVMFGEYVPMASVLPFLSAFTPNQASFTPGPTSTVMRIEQPAIAFSPLICFEDTMPGLARQAVRDGARLLINQTNDAWFEELWAARQHMAHCVFRCIENRVPAIRCANTGVSCFINHLGTIEAALLDEAGSPYLEGVLDHWVFVPSELTLTPYTRNGDLFAYACVAFTFAIALVLRTSHSYSRS